MQIKKYFYYGPFLFTTGAFQAIGLGYYGEKNGQPRWDRVIGVIWYECEAAHSVATMFRVWNHQVHLWLKFYILARIQKGPRPSTFESMFTFVVSGFWHGFYPSYYLMFFTAALLQEVTKDVYKSWALFHQIIPSATFRFVLAWILSNLCMNHNGVLFGALTMEKSLFFLNHTYWYQLVGCTVLLIGMRAGNLVGISKKIEKKLEAGKAKKE